MFLALFLKLIVSTGFSIFQNKDVKTQSHYILKIGIQFEKYNREKIFPLIILSSSYESILSLSSHSRDKPLIT